MERSTALRVDESASPADAGVTFGVEDNTLFTPAQLGTIIQQISQVSDEFAASSRDSALTGTPLVGTALVTDASVNKVKVSTAPSIKYSILFGMNVLAALFDEFVGDVFVEVTDVSPRSLMWCQFFTEVRVNSSLK